MRKIKTHQLITLIGVVIYMVLAVMLQNYKELTVNMEFLIGSTLSPLLFIYFPFFVINFLKKVFTKEAQSERNKTIIVSVMTIFILASLHSDYTMYNLDSKYYDIFNMIGSNGEKLELSVISYPSPLSAGDWPESAFKKKNKELKSEYKIGDKIRIEYSINDKGDSFIPPDVSDFKLLSKPVRSSSSSYKSEDGEVTNTTTTTYSINIEAKTVGLYTINSASIIVNGKRISSEEIQLNIISSYLNK